MTQKAFTIGLGPLGSSFVAVCLFFFAGSTILSWAFFGEQNIKYLFGSKAVRPYKMIIIVFLIMGSVLKVDLVWNLADFFNGIMVLPNIIALFALGKFVSMALEEFNRDVK